MYSGSAGHIYEQSLVDAIRSDIGGEHNKPSVLDITAVPFEQQQETGEACPSQFSSQKFSNNAQCNNDSLDRHGISNIATKII